MYYMLFSEKVYVRSQILEHPSIGEYWNFSGVVVLPENMIFFSLESASGMRKPSQNTGM